MTLTTKSGLLHLKKKEETPSANFAKPVLPAELPARLRIVQKYNKGDDGKIEPQNYVTITYNHIGEGRGGSFKVPRAVLEILWKSLGR